ncbi:MAG: hypothetical protein H7Z14_05750 [Anaerolineae bacterium]|nr:hypothetical protein [Phycisphaerae bacterium]
MKRSLRSLFAAFVIIACVSFAMPALAVVLASGDFSKPSQETSHPLVPVGGEDGFQINESVEHDLNFGPWRKRLINTRGSGIPSGNDILIRETLTNIGGTPWTDWHERVISRTTIAQPDDSPGFLFQAGSLVVSANYGAGFVNLVQGVDYQRVITPYSGPPDPGNNGNGEAINIFLAPNRVIENGDVLRIEKRIFEVFGDANVWMPGQENAAVIGQFPTVPEPGAVMMCVIAIAFLRMHRRGAVRW